MGRQLEYDFKLPESNGNAALLINTVTPVNDNITDTIAPMLTGGEMPIRAVEASPETPMPTGGDMPISAEEASKTAVAMSGAADLISLGFFDQDVFNAYDQDISVNPYGYSEIYPSGPEGPVSAGGTWYAAYLENNGIRHGSGHSGLVNNGAGYVVLDAGHGGIDPGSSAFGVFEKDIALEVAVITAGLLDEAGVEYFMTRNDDDFVPVEHRIERLNSDSTAFAVSIHCDWFKQKTINGTSVLYNVGDAAAKELAKLLLTHITDGLGTEDRGVHPHTDILLLREAQAPAVLVELAFMSNKRDMSLLMTDEFKLKAARNIASGICAALGKENNFNG